MNRMQLMKIHSLLAAFILPVAIMFMLTGSLYTWGIKGKYVSDVYELSLEEPIRSDLGALTALVESELHRLAISYPEGNPRLKQYANHFQFEWTGSSKDVILEPTGNESVAKLTVKHTTWYRNLVQLHKAKGGIAFKVYAAVFAIAIAILLVSGFIMAWQTPKLKRATLVSSVIGLGSFIVFVWLS